ncbi:MAG: ComEC/Rec2 family competence protein [Mailhella sp.]|nr:ComEC/Rec2 family competence protein [Mailhella sp.]
MRAPLESAAFLILLSVVSEKRGFGEAVRRFLKLALAFLLGVAVMLAASPEVPDKPSWSAVPRQAVLVEGAVDSVKGLPGGRIRLLLKELRPVALTSEMGADREDIAKSMAPPRHASAENGKKSYAGKIFPSEGAELPGLAALTLSCGEEETFGRPAAGQKVTALLRLYPSGGSINASEGGFNAYWASHKVWHNARLVKSRGDIVLFRLGEGDGFAYNAAMKRESWRREMESLFTESEGEKSAPEGRQIPYPFHGSDAGESVCSQGKAMLTALLFGDRSGLSLRTVDLFTRAGLVHSLALSGQHLALALLAGALCVFVAVRLKPDLYRLRPKRILLACAGLPFALGYLFLGGAPFSLIRAALMMTAGTVFLCLRRSTAPLDALFIAAFLLFLGWPLAVFDLSVQLSVLAVAGILLSMPLVTAFCRRFSCGENTRLGRRLLFASIRWTGSMLIISCAAQTAVLPILISVFGAVSPCFWLNVIWLPPLSFITLPLAALGLILLIAFGPQACSELLFTAAAWPADAMIYVLEYLDAGGWLFFIQCPRPPVLSSLGYGAAFAALAFMVQARLSGRKISCAVRRLLAFGVLFMLVGYAPQWADDIKAKFEQRVELSLIDVGQGQAVLLDYPSGRILVDGGGSSSPYFDCGRSIVAPALTEGRLPMLDAVIVSHTDVDHARGLRWILEHFRVGVLYWSPVSASRADRGEGLALREAAQRHGIPEKILRAGDTLDLGNGLKLEVLAPDIAPGSSIPEARELSSNNASLALRLVRNGHGLALLCGDMLSPALRKLACDGRELKADVLVLPHHGAASSFQKRLYDAVEPDAALASAAPFTRYGFPSWKVREEMKRRRVPVFSTSELGTIRVRWTRQGDGDVLSLPDMP